MTLDCVWRKEAAVKGHFCLLLKVYIKLLPRNREQFFQSLGE